MQFGAIPAVVGGHDCLGASGESGEVALAMDVVQLGLSDYGIALIHPVLGAAVANKVLGGGNHMAGAKAVATITLQAGDNFSGIGFDYLRVF